VAFLHDPSQQAGSLLDLAPEHEERCLQIVFPQRVEDPRGVARIRAIVEGQGDPAPRGPDLAVGGKIGPGILGYRSVPDPPHVGLSRVGRFGKGSCFRQYGPCIYSFGGAVERRPEGEKHHNEEEREDERDAPNHKATTAGAPERVGDRRAPFATCPVRRSRHIRAC
jgi:hypothetical protein